MSRILLFVLIGLLAAGCTPAREKLPILKPADPPVAISRAYGFPLSLLSDEAIQVLSRMDGAIVELDRYQGLTRIRYQPIDADIFTVEILPLTENRTSVYLTGTERHPPDTRDAGLFYSRLEKQLGMR